jgi:uncharacterized protein (UPF0335 family)
MAQTHLSDNVRVTGVSRAARQKLKAFMLAEKDRRDQVAAIRDEGKEELAVLVAQGFDRKALRQALSELRRDENTEPEIRDVRDAYLSAMRGS